MNIVADHVATLVQFQTLSETTLQPQPNEIDPDKYWRYFSKFPNDFARGLAKALQNQEQEFVTYDHLSNILTIK